MEKEFKEVDELIAEYLLFRGFTQVRVSAVWLPVKASPALMDCIKE